MKVAIVSPWAISEESIGGTERFIIDLASILHDIGETVEVFMLSGKSRTINSVKYISLDILGQGKAADEYALRRLAYGSKNEDFYEMWARRLENAVDISEFDVIQINSLLFINAWPNKPRIFTIHTNPFEYALDWGDSRLEQVVHKVRAGSLNKTVFTTPSEHYGSYFSKALNQNVRVIPHAIELSRLAKIAVRKHTKSAAQEAAVTILLPSRLEPVQKRPQIVFEGVALLPKRERERIQIIASGADTHYRDNYISLESIAANNGFKARFMTFRTMAEAYYLADIVALPSKSESFGYAALESLSLGIPTILNSLPTYREIGADNANAHFFDETAESFSRALLKLLRGDIQKRSHVSQSWLKRYDMRLWAKKYQTLAKDIS
ncbi:MAG TPA: glycosyltransferase family 4 protein [Candidatus Saccharimonadales bacterium]|nr:glycosyltransferase family 4 protein [Candidatus Saccharimonadales bacterium]